jgi:ribosomal protein S18 acetylase RimI-like enzyme
MSACTFIEITRALWSEYRGDILALENEYPDALSADEEEYLKIIGRENSLCLVLLSDEKVAGCAIGFPLNGNEVAAYRLESVWTDDSFYLESITVASAFQGKGLGLSLMTAFAERIRRIGYRRIVGHFRENGSFAIVKKMGGTCLHTEHNWYDTGENYQCCSLLLG